MKLTRDYFDVHLDQNVEATPDTPPDVITHRVCYSHADRLRSELEATKRNVPLGASYNLTSIGLWCALVREGSYGGTYDQFVTQLINWDAVPTLVPEAVDPTQPAAGAGSPSISPSASLSSTGSTPTSTSD